MSNDKRVSYPILFLALLFCVACLIISADFSDGKEKAITKAISFETSPEQIRDCFIRPKAFPDRESDINSKLGRNNLSSFLLRLIFDSSCRFFDGLHRRKFSEN